ncbi:MAG: DNA mismatch repair protein MutT [Phenylobacterium zucineum]|nr:MAG: DNA mismatch repair protein MutT [Phenylobacterium zucineum]
MNQVHVVAAIFVRDGEILATRRAEHKAAAGFWEFPGGKVEHGEVPQDALAREILEELGVSIKVGDLVDDSTTETEHGLIRLACYLVEETSAWPTLSSDHDLFKWMSRDAIGSLEWAAPDLPAVAKLWANWPQD